MGTPAEILKQELAEIKGLIRQQKEKAATLEELTGRGDLTGDYRVNFWELSPAELDREMGARLSAMNEDIDIRPRGDITSHRRILGPLIVAFKKLLRRLTAPYINLILDRQRRFNEDLVNFHLATFIRLRQTDERLRAFQEELRALREKVGENLPDER